MIIKKAHLLLSLFTYLSIVQISHAQTRNDTLSCNLNIEREYELLSIKELSFDEILSEGVATLSKQLSTINVPIRQFQFLIKWYIRHHHFTIEKKELKKAKFKVISYAYPTLSPQGDCIMLSGLVSFPNIKNNKIKRMLIYHRILASSNKIAPSNNIPIEAVLSVDNTICVFPDYYGCGITEGNPLPYMALNYHAMTATDCMLTAIKIIRDNGIITDSDFYTWNTGYSQGGGYALSTHKYIENNLPDSLSKTINLRWSLCGNGIYNPSNMYKKAVLENNLGTTPSAYYQSIRGLLRLHRHSLDSMSFDDILSTKAKYSKVDSILNTPDDGMWDLEIRIGNLTKSNVASDHFSSLALDTTSSLYKTIYKEFSLDNCDEGWQPNAAVVLYHSKRDNLISYDMAHEAFEKLTNNNGNCTIISPKINRGHFISAFFYFSQLLLYNEEELFHKYIQASD